jgi:hypothetical protein
VSRRIVIGVVALASMLALARAAVADPPALYVVFHPDHTFSVSLASGQTVGTTSGPPSVIPAGTYNLLVDDTSDTDALFDLAGPGVKLVTDMTHGEDATAAFTETFQPNSTYTYRDDMRPSLVWTFVTSSDSVGSATGGPAGTTSSGVTSSGGKSTSSSDVVGSAIATLRGPLDAAISTAGKLTLSVKGKRLSSLKEGRYAVVVVDRSKALGFELRASGRRPITITTAPFVGRRALVVTFKPGRWLAYSAAGKRIAFSVTT